jgi:F-type H+-transporting ATPase subunit b
MNQHWTIPGDNALHESTGTHGAQSEQNPLVKLDPGLFIWTVLTFVLLLTVLAKFAWKPLLLMLDERNKSIEESLLSAEKARKELENINQESEAILMKAKTAAQSVISEARVAADNIKEDIVSKARDEAEGQLEKAKTQINVEKDKAMSEIREEVVNLSILVAEKIINKNISKEDNVDLIKKSLDSIEGYEA